MSVPPCFASLKYQGSRRRNVSVEASLAAAPAASSFRIARHLTCAYLPRVLIIFLFSKHEHTSHINMTALSFAVVVTGLSRASTKASAPMQMAAETAAVVKKLSVGDLKDEDLKGKKVLVRCDLNVPLTDKVIGDDTRIRASIPTVEYLLGKGEFTYCYCCTYLCCSHHSSSVHSTYQYCCTLSVNVHVHSYLLQRHNISCCMIRSACTYCSLLVLRMYFHHSMTWMIYEYGRSI